VPSWQVTGWSVRLTVVFVKLEVCQTLKEEWQETPNICATQPVFPNLQIFTNLLFRIISVSYLTFSSRCVSSYNKTHDKIRNSVSTSVLLPFPANVSVYFYSILYMGNDPTSIHNDSSSLTRKWQSVVLNLTTSNKVPLESQ